jgi:molybdopterin/thiamine biosynthesis adenylyltransferase
MRKLHPKTMKRTSKNHVLIIGAGGICHAALPSILSLPIQKITIMDGDEVSEEPLERQWIFTKNDIGQSKVNVLNSWISRRKSDLEVVPIARFFQGEIEFFPDFVFDFTDRQASKQFILRFCQEHKIPLIYAASQRNHGAVGFLAPGSSLYGHLVHENTNHSETEISCLDGVTTSVVGTIGMQAAHLAWLYFQKEKMKDALYYFEGIKNEWSHFAFNDAKIETEKGSFVFHNASDVVDFLKANQAGIIHIGYDENFDHCLPSELKNKLEFESKDIILTCINGNESVAAAKSLRESFTHVYAFSGKSEALKNILKLNVYAE